MELVIESWQVKFSGVKGIGGRVQNNMIVDEFVEMDGELSVPKPLGNFEW